MRIVHTADWHLVNRSPILIDRNDARFTKPVNIRLLDKIYRIHDIIKYCVNKAVDVLIIAGDIYDNNNPGAELKVALSKLIAIIVKNRIHIIIIPGNHDETIWNDVSHLTIDSKYLNIVTKPKTIKIDGVHFHCVPYMKTGIESVVREFIDKRQLYGERNILVAHLMVKDCILSLDQIAPNNIEGLDEEQLRGFDYVALGDVHFNQKIGNAKRVAKGNQIWYSGSIVKNSFAEANDKKYFNIIDIGDKIIVKRRKLVDRTFYNLFPSWKQIQSINKMLQRGIVIPICNKKIIPGSIIKMNIAVPRMTWKTFNSNRFVENFLKIYRVEYLKLNTNYVEEENVKLDTMLNSFEIMKKVINTDLETNPDFKQSAIKSGNKILKEL